MFMKMTWDLSGKPSRLAMGIAALPIVDCLVNQLNTAFNLSAAGLSSLQILRGALLIIFSILCAIAIVRSPYKLCTLPISILGGFLLIAMAVSKELASTGTIDFTGLVPYGQFLYWILLWCTVCLLCTSKADATLILRGIVIGSVMTAFSVFLGLIVGTGNFYSSDSVRASAGWFETAKMITGVLITGGIVILFLGSVKQSLKHVLLACLVFAACIFTYARAGTVALLAALAWLFLWGCLWGRRHRQYGVYFASVCAVLFIGMILVVSPSQMLSRWSDIDNGDAAGSGRATFWHIAIDEFMNETPADQLAGRGYASMSTMLYEKYGDDIKHTHNDGFDLLLVGGAIGFLWLVLLAFDLSHLVLISPISSEVRAAAMAIFLVYLCHSQLTGQIWGTDAMTYYVLSLSSLFTLGKQERSSPRNQSDPVVSRLRKPYRFA
jgi:O-antigen ligase